MAPPVILFGAFDRHNVGDLLFAQVAAALLPGRRLLFAGLADRDLRPCGGHQVVALRRLAAGAQAAGATLLHVGGELLTCSAWQAAVMLLPADEAPAAIGYLAQRPAERRAWLQRLFGSDEQAPYVVSRQQHPGLARVVFAAVGGADLDHADPALRAEVLGKLRAADALSVREARTAAHLAAAGIAAAVVPDPAVMTAELFGETIARAAAAGEAAALRGAWAAGYLAVQFSAEFGDHGSLREIARQLDQVCAASGLGVALFRAGAAPWHDALPGLEQVAAWMRPGAARVLRSPDLWAVCALIAGSRGFCGSSLHGRIVATAFGLPRLNLRAPVAAARSGKQAAYAATWDAAGAPAEVELPAIASGLQAALARPAALLRQQAREQAAVYRQAFAAQMAALDEG